VQSGNFTARVNVDMDDADGQHHAGQLPNKYPIRKLPVNVARTIEPVSLRIARSG
jgi:hypothetical protein